PGRRWSEGLHQAIEAKEGVQVQRESRTLATITFQNYFRMYQKLAGMTGTAETSAEEFQKVYDLEVVSIPTHRPMIRKDMQDLVFRTEQGKYKALVREIKERHQRGQPILIGTVSIEKSERLGRMLGTEGIPHHILNAKNHEQEALIIAQAGRRGSVTVATNMAGRGVDILLGGNSVDEKEPEAVKEVGGLHVLGTERHEARRIDNQLRGRSGRQGDPGSSQFFLSFEDDVLRIFGSNRVTQMMESFGIPEDEPMEHKMVSKLIESAQAKIEGFHFDTRKHVLEYDDVLNKQRDAIYRMRREILFSTHPASHNEEEYKDARAVTHTRTEQILEMIAQEIKSIVEAHTASPIVEEWNLEEIAESVHAIAGIPLGVHEKLITIRDESLRTEEKQESIEKTLRDLLTAQYRQRTQEVGEEQMRSIERAIFLQAIDALWMDHLDQMEHLRDSVRLRAYGQRDPLVEYKNEGSRLFRELQHAIRNQVVNAIFKVGTPIREGIVPSRIQFQHPDASHPGVATQMPASAPLSQPSNSNPHPKNSVGRNDPCPCGSGKKYKKCHMT
ncbi:MAG: preprotein translocase subunit SecA, partial [Parcubacteria group bacterium Gr01-1014_66]